MVVNSDECVPRLLAFDISDRVWILCADVGYMILDVSAEFIDYSLADIGREGRDYAVAVVEHSLWQLLPGSRVVLHDHHGHAEAAVDAYRPAHTFYIVVEVVAVDL